MHRAGADDHSDSGDEADQITAASGREGHQSHLSTVTDPKSRVILHVDCDEFFLQVHGLVDDHLKQIILSSPCALWQYNDVISMNAAAKALGVKKHMLPHQAEEVLKPASGFLIHAFWRRWPGPRVNYRPYQLYSRHMFRVLEQALRRNSPVCGVPIAVVEKASMDEAYIDVTCLAGGCLEKGHGIARALQQAVLQDLGMRVSIGCARNRLLSKLASAASKLIKSTGEAAQRLLMVPDSSAEVAAFLGDIPAGRFPGLGAKEQQLGVLGATTVSDLRAFSEAQLASDLGVTHEVARRVYNGCRGQDDTPVIATVPPKSLVVTSWTTHTLLKDIAVKEHLGRGGASVVVGGGWLFEAHEGNSKSNDTRCRWILLSMVLDLVDKIQTTWMDWALIPSKLTVGWQGCGTDPVPGPGFKYLNSETKSRTIALPMEAREACASWQTQDPAKLPGPTVLTNVSFAALGSSQPSKPSASMGEQALVPSKDNVYITPNRTLSAEGPEQLEQGHLCKCVAALVDLAAGVICGFVQEDRSAGIERQIGQLTVSVSGFQQRSTQKGIHTWLTKCRGFPEAEPSSPRSDTVTPVSQGTPMQGGHAENRMKQLSSPLGVGRDVSAVSQDPRQSSTQGEGPATSMPHARIDCPYGKNSTQLHDQYHRPKGFDRAVWDGLPPNIKCELQGDPTLRQHQDLRGSRLCTAVPKGPAPAAWAAGQQRRPKKQRIGAGGGTGSQSIKSFFAKKSAS